MSEMPVLSLLGRLVVLSFQNQEGMCTVCGKGSGDRCS